MTIKVLMPCTLQICNNKFDHPFFMRTIYARYNQDTFLCVLRKRLFYSNYFATMSLSHRLARYTTSSSRRRIGNPHAESHVARITRTQTLFPLEKYSLIFLISMNYITEGKFIACSQVRREYATISRNVQANMKG